MKRVACLYLPEFALQVHGQGHALAHKRPFVVVDRDHPQGKVVARNELAAKSAIKVGMRYAQALSINLELCAVAWDEAALHRCQQALAKACLDYTPDVECHAHAPGVIWLFWSGLERMYPCLQSWATKVLDRVQTQGWVAHIVVGFGRRSSYAAAQCLKDPLWVAPDPAQEQRLASTLPVASMGLSAKKTRALRDLGVHTLGDLQRLSAGELSLRFGQEMLAWHELAKRIDWGMGTRVKLKAKICARLEFDEPVQHRDALSYHICQALPGLLTKVQAQGYELAGLEITFGVQGVWGGKDAHEQQELIMLAAPSAQGAGLSRLIELRLQTSAPVAGVHRIDLLAKVATRVKEQGVLWGELATRDLQEGDKALAVIRAELGNEAVQRAVLCREHLPEQRFRWQPLDQVKAPLVNATTVSGLVRRIEQDARKLDANQTDLGACKPLWGPYLVESDWWSTAIAREEYYMLSRDQTLHWVFFDRCQKRWFVQGHVGA